MIQHRFRYPGHRTHHSTLMKLTNISLAALWLIATASGSQAALVQWQAAVNDGSAPAATVFTTVSSAVLVDVGTLTGDRSFEFIVNATSGTPSSALLGSFTTGNGRQALKFEQFNATGTIGMTSFGVEDYFTTIPTPGAVDTQIVFASDGTKTDLYINGVFQTTILNAASGNVALGLTGEQGLGGAWNPATSAYVDPLVGSILGFASYDSNLSAGEILTHYTAFAAPIPEPAAAGFLGLAGLAGLMRRSRRA